MKSPPIVQLIDTTNRETKHLNSLIAHFTELREKKHSQKPTRRVIKKAEKTRKFFRKYYPREQKELLVKVYYGSEETFNRPRFTVYRIAKLFRMPKQTAQHIINQFKQAGKSFSAFDAVVRPKFRMIKPDLQAKLLNTDLLQRWIKYS